MSGDASEPEVLQKGKSIRPPVCDDMVETIVNELYGMTVTSYIELPSYVDRNYHVHVMPDHSNPYMEGQLSKHGYNLKVLNSMESERPAYVDAMHAMSHHLYKHDIPCPQPLLNLKGNMITLRRIPASYGEQSDSAADMFCVRLFTFIPGQTMHMVPYTPALLFRTGQYAGRIDRILQEFHNSCFDSHPTMWSLASVPKLSEFIYAVKKKEDRDIVITIIDTFKSDVIPQYTKLNKGMIHGDLNAQNIIVNTSDEDDFNLEHDIVGVIDLGDARYSYIVFEVAIMVCDMMVTSSVIDPLDAVGYVLAGYTSVMSLNETELDILKACIAGRLCQLLVMGAYTYSIDPGNEYLLTTANEGGWALLYRFWSTPKQVLYHGWKKIIRSYNK